MNTSKKQEAIPSVQPGFYWHYKHFLDEKAPTEHYAYEVLGLQCPPAERPNADFQVVYRPLYASFAYRNFGHNIFDPPRPFKEFMQKVKCKDGQTRDRFQLITDKDAINELTEKRKSMYE